MKTIKPGKLELQFPGMGSVRGKNNICGGDLVLFFVMFFIKFVCDVNS